MAESQLAALKTSIADRDARIAGLERTIELTVEALLTKNAAAADARDANTRADVAERERDEARRAASSKRCARSVRRTRATSSSAKSRPTSARGARQAPGGPRRVRDHGRPGDRI